jgi:DNA-binding MarR family transcriptional regulator
MHRLQDPQEHDDLLNYRLKRLLALGGAPAIRLCEGRFGVSRFEWRLVAALVESGASSPSALAERAHVELPRVSRTLRRLIGKELVERRAAAADARRFVVAATAAGEALYQSLWPELVAINRRVASVLSPEEAVALDRCLAKLTAQAQRLEDEGGGVDVRTDRRLGGSRRFWSEALD